MKMFSYPQDSILRKTLLYLVDISESYYDYLISEFEHFSFLDLELNDSDKKKFLHFNLYPEDPLHYILLLSLDYLYLILESDNDFNRIFQKVLNQINKVLKLEFKQKEKIPACHKRIFRGIDFSNFNKLNFSPTYLPEKQFSYLTEKGMAYWSDISDYSELRAMENFRTPGVLIGFLHNIYNLIESAKQYESMMSQNEEVIWQDYELLIFNWIKQSLRNQKNINRNSRILMERLGVIDRRKKTLTVIGEKYNLTRERVRQIENRLVKYLETPYSLYQLKPIYLVSDAIIQKFGVLSGQNLTEELARYFGWKAKPSPKFLTLLLKISCSINDKQIFTINNKAFFASKYFIKNCNQCNAMQDFAKKTLDNFKEIKINDLINKINIFCNNICFAHFRIKFSQSLIIYLENQVDWMKTKESYVYDIDTWTAKYGKRPEFLEYIIKKSNRAMHFTEVYEIVREMRLNINEHYVHATLTSSEKILLWGRGSFLHIENAPFPYNLIREIEKWIEIDLQKNKPFISVYGPLKFFEKQLQDKGIPSEEALYSCLRISADPRLVYPRYPYIYLSKLFSERIPLPIILENFFIQAGGPVKKKEISDFLESKIYVKDFIVEQTLSRTPNIIRCGRGKYIHINYLTYDKKTLNEIAKYIRETADTRNHISIEKIFNAQKVKCKLSGITNPILLFSIIQLHQFDGIVAERYPIIKSATNSEDTNVGVKAEIINYIKDKERFCPYTELEEFFIEKRGYRESTVYSIIHHEKIFRYLPSCLIHYDTIGWSNEKQTSIEILASKLFEKSVKLGKYYGLIDEMIDDQLLPKLKNDLFWTPTLLAELLDSNEKIKLLGNSRNTFIIQPNSLGINSFPDLIYQLLKKEFNGSTNLEEFSEYLVNQKIVIRKLTKGMLGDSDLVKIIGKEIVIKEIAKCLKN